MVQMHRDHAGRLGYSCFLSVVWGCQRAADYAIKGRLIHAAQPWFVLGPYVPGYSGLISVQGVRSIAGTTVLQAAAAQQLHLSVRSNF
jgi:hypothetical protein